MDSSELPLPDLEDLEPAAAPDARRASPAPSPGLYGVSSVPPAPQSTPPTGPAPSPSTPPADAPPVALWLLEWPGEPAAAIGALEALGLSRDRARATLAEMPIQVARRLERPKAERIAKHLQDAGGRVALRQTRAASGRALRPDAIDGALPSTPPPATTSSAPPRRPLPPADLGPTGRGGATPILSTPPGPTPEEVGFWKRVPVAFVVPVIGSGWIWMVGLTLSSLLLSMVPLIVGAAVVLKLMLAGAYLQFFAHCFRIGINDEKTRGLPLLRKPGSTGDSALGGNLFTRGLGVVLMWALIGLAFAATVPLLEESYGTLVLLGLGFATPFYVLMAITRIAMSGRVLAGLAIPSIVISAFAGGIAYAFTAFLGVALLFSWSFLRMAIGPEHPLLGLIAGVGVAYTLGVQGYLMGRLVDLKGGLGSS
ncbi:MAG: hypothetical protein CMN31_27885 [Sandaracinus sp.]|nr:hypothetical protein [Myxococcales bacterium]MAT23839.1 hypothetical protein [Sandaracinus sp.]MBJ75105.1 hypothetical protein [Sandaracinus sp.]HJL24188.1 hypothetical protein [Polyangiaceae bacterium LLY-WYZ-15_(1-7)]